MGKVFRYTDEMIEEYVKAGYWTKELTVDFWDRNALLYPEKEAIVDSKCRLTWSQAKQKIDTLALNLINLGFKKDDVILVQLYNSVELTLIRLACEKAGILLAIVPYTFRHAEIESVLKYVCVKGVVIPYEFRSVNYFEMYKEINSHVKGLEYIFIVGDKIPENTISLQEMMENKPKTPAEESLLDKRKFGPFEFQEIMVTSGTTGLPKCVEWTGCARLCQARHYIKRLNLTEEDVIAAFAPSIGGSTECIVHRAAPQVAAKIVMLERFTPEKACEMIEKEKITVVGIVPTMLIRLLEYPKLKEHNLTSLRVMVTSTAPLPPYVAKKAEEKLGCIIVQGYGSMDSGGITISGIEDSPEVRWFTVGKPFPGVEVKLINEEGKEVPTNEVGIVTVRGPTCVGGYYNDPESTRKAWEGGRFKMGDLGMFDVEGNLKLVGRTSDVIIRGGQNIYPKEIEDILFQHEKIADVAIVRMPDPEMGEKACAFVVVKPGEVFTFEEMVSFLKQKRIAPFKIPERLEIVESLPLTPGENKVNKRLLEEMIVEKLKKEGVIKN